MKFLIAGELNPDLVMQEYSSFPELGKEVLVKDLVLALGSASAICAVGLARLGNNVSLAAKVGLDAWGDFCSETLRKEGVDTSRLIRDAKLKTGLTVSLTAARDRALVTYLGAIAELRSDDVPDEVLRGYQHLHVSSYFLQTRLRPGCRDLFDRARRLGLTTSLDPGFDPEEQWGADLLDTLSVVDVFFPNEVELRALGKSDDVETALKNLPAKHTIAKLGSDGCATLLEGKLVRVPAYPVTPVDTTGAGDSFNAGFLHSWKQGASIEDSMRFAAVCGALSTLAFGGTAGQPNAAEVERQMRSIR